MINGLCNSRALQIVVFICLSAIATRCQLEPQVKDTYKHFFREYATSYPTALPRALQPTIRAISPEHQDNFRSFALIAGISLYPNMPNEYRSLDAAAEDVRSLSDYLKNIEKFDEIVVLENEDVNYNNLAYFLQSYFPTQMKELKQHNIHSRFLFAYSGHGVEDGLTSYALLSLASNFDDRDPTASLNLHNIRVLIDGLVEHAYQVLVLLNTCNSGAFLRSQFGRREFSPTRSGAHAIVAGTKKQLAWSDPEVGPGSLLFENLYAALRDQDMVESPSSPSSSLPIVTVDRLYRYLSQKIEGVTQNGQSPKLGDLAVRRSSGSFFFFDLGRLAADGVMQSWHRPGSEPSASGAFERSFGQAAIASEQATLASGAWPPNAVPGGSYIVRKDEEVMEIPLLRLPDNFTIKLASDVRSLSWKVKHLEFGQNATIDLSSADDAPVPGQAGADIGELPSWGAKGGTGLPGNVGASGMSGRSMDLLVENKADHGSLWVRTDGSAGAPGGRGGNGQSGGGLSCDQVSAGRPTDGGQGGDGGKGGNGGQGGATSVVKILIAGKKFFADKCIDSDYSEDPPSLDVNSSCGPSSRPALAVGDDGTITVFGHPGCGGAPGPGGAGGPGGDEGKVLHCSTLGVPVVSGGRSGRSGISGQSGLPGQCTR